MDDSLLEDDAAVHAERLAQALRDVLRYADLHPSTEGYATHDVYYTPASKLRMEADRIEALDKALEVAKLTLNRHQLFVNRNAKTV